MPLDLLSLALLTCRIAYTNSASSEEALDAIARAIHDKYSNRKRCGRGKEIRPDGLRFTSLGIIISTMKTECRGQIHSRRANNIAALNKVIRDGSWTVPPAQAVRLIASVEECLILSYNWTFTVDPNVQKVRDTLFDTVLMIMANTRGPHLLREALLYSLVDLVFMFSCCEDTESRRNFLVLNGLQHRKTAFTATVVEAQRVILATDIVNFHVDVIHSYAAKHDPDAMRPMLRTVLACLGVFAEQEALEHFCSHTW